MVIYEKMINDEIYTILSNRETGKIALLAQTVQINQLTKLNQYFGDEFKKVEYINSDMAPVYLKYCKESFPNALLTADKFHVISQVLDTIQAVRMRLKNNELQKLPTKKEKKNLNEIKKEEIKGIESKIEMLTRSKYLLMKRADKWKPWQKQRANLLFNAFPDLEKAYYLIEKLRDWYNRKNIGKTWLSIEKKLRQWTEDVELANIEEMKGLVKMFDKHQEIILNYCITGQTNAMAENINSRIQRFININYGVRDQNFFFFRLKQYYA